MIVRKSITDLKEGESNTHNPPVSHLLLLNPLRVCTLTLNVWYKSFSVETDLVIKITKLPKIKKKFPKQIYRVLRNLKGTVHPSPVVHLPRHYKNP